MRFLLASAVMVRYSREVAWRKGTIQDYEAEAGEVCAEAAQ